METTKFVYSKHKRCKSVGKNIVNRLHYNVKTTTRQNDTQVSSKMK